MTLDRIVAAMTLNRIVARMTLDIFVKFDTTVAYFMSLIALLTSSPVMWRI
jgi:hypothetical protein